MSVRLLSDGSFEDQSNVASITSLQEFQPMMENVPATPEAAEAADNEFNPAIKPQPFRPLNRTRKVAHDNYSTADVKGNTAEYVREQLRLLRKQRQQAGLPDLSREEEDQFKDAAKSEYAARSEQAKWNARSMSDNKQQDAKDWALEEMRRRRRAGLDMTAEEQRQLKADLQELYESKVGIGESDDEGVCNLCGSESGTASICDSCKENLEDFDEEEQKEKDKNKDRDPRELAFEALGG